MPTYNEGVVSPTRYFVESDIPSPKNVSTKFVYNYFVPDEAAEEDTTFDASSPKFKSYLNKDETGNPYVTDSSGKKMVFVNGKLATADVLNRISPRFVEISWLHDTSIPAKIIEDNIETLYRNNSIIKEEEISSVYDTSVRIFDPTLRERLLAKLNALNNIMGTGDSGETIFESNVIDHVHDKTSQRSETIISQKKQRE